MHLKPTVAPAFLAVLLSLTSSGAHALDLPVKSEKDHRVRYANYDDADVIQLDAVVGVATHIQLEPGETYVFHVFGDSSAYEFTHKLNHIFFKPVQEQADSNLTVITDRRAYNFQITYHDDRTAKALYKLVVRYPQTQAAAHAQAYQEAAVGRALDYAPQAYNWQSYTKSGDIAIAPVHAWDNGTHTWMQFAPGAEIPAIYRVDSSGQELLANFHVVDQRTVVLHRTSARWHIRLGSQVVAIRNHSNVLAPQSTTGTTSPQVQRLIKGAQTPTPAAATAQTFAPAAMDIPEPASTDQVLEVTPAFAVLDDGFILKPREPSRVAPTPAEPTAQPAAAGKSSATPYSLAEGDRQLTPSKIWLQDQHTHFQFDDAGLPALVALDEHGDEYLTGLHIEPGNVMVMHDQPAGWRLRLGDKTLTLKKDAHE